MGNNAGIGQLYAAAVFELAKETQQVEAVRNDLLSLWALAQSEKEFIDFSASPYFSKDAKQDLIQKMFTAKISGLTMDFLAVVNKHNRMAYLQSIAQEYEKLRDAHTGLSLIEATFAKEVSENQIADFKRQLETSLNCEIKLVVKVDPSIIGGVILRRGDKIVDNTIKKELRGAVLAITGRRKNQG